MTGKPPLENISHAAIASVRKGARSKAVNVVCPVCGPTCKGASAMRKVLRTWTLGGDRISLHCARCGLQGWVGPDGGTQRTETPVVSTEVSADDEERRRRRNAEFAERIWKEAYPIAGTAGHAYNARRGIDLSAVPDYGGLRWHPVCPWAEGETRPCVVSRFSDVVSGEPAGIHRRPITGEMARSLGRTKGCVVRLWPDELVSIGLVVGEGIETVLAAATGRTHRGTLLQPAWACGHAGNLTDFPVLAGIEALTILVDHDESGTGQKAAAACAARWRDAGREVIRLTPTQSGADFNDLVVRRRGGAA